jgi:putative spermidine/putrescine transport system substrate-binding protein
VRTPFQLGLAGLAAASLLAAGCGSSSSSSSGGYNWSNATSAAAGGGMSALVAAAKKEGTLNVIALPNNWANYGTIIKDFTTKYGRSTPSRRLTAARRR